VGSHSHRVTRCPVQCRGQQHSIAAHTLPCGCLSLLSRPQPGIRQHIVPCLARRSRHLPLQRCVLVEWQLVWLILIPLWLLQRSRQQGWETDSAATRAATNRARVGYLVHGHKIEVINPDIILQHHVWGRAGHLTAH